MAARYVLPACLRRSEETVVRRDEPGTPAAAIVATPPPPTRTDPPWRPWPPATMYTRTAVGVTGPPRRRRRRYSRWATSLWRRPSSQADTSGGASSGSGGGGGARIVASSPPPPAASLAKWVRTVGPCSGRASSAGSWRRRPRPASPHGGPIQRGAVAATADPCGNIAGQRRGPASKARGRRLGR